jgi:hypothetical protein
MAQNVYSIKSERTHVQYCSSKWGKPTKELNSQSQRGKKLNFPMAPKQHHSVLFKYL